MTFRRWNHNTSARTTARCAMCGAGVVSQGDRRRDLLCLICRAAILDRVFRARLKQMRAVKAS